MKPHRVWWTGLVLLMVTVAGCDDGGDLPEPTDPTGPSPEPPEPPGPPPPGPGVTLSITGGGHNVSERFTSDLWVHGTYAYTGTWGAFGREGNPGNALKIWALDATGAPELADSLILPDVGTVSDVEVSADGAVLMLSAEWGSAAGLYLYDLADPAKPTLLDRVHVEEGLHTATFGEIANRRYAFTARNPGTQAQGTQALTIFDVTDPSAIELVASVPIPPTYGIHDTYVRDGLAFVFAWDAGVIIYDVGNGIRGGSPEAPVEVSRLVTQSGDAGSPAVHNGWWFHNPVTDEARYLFIGQEPRPSPGGGQLSPRRGGDPQLLDGRGGPGAVRRLLQWGRGRARRLRHPER
jgi:hypothetical protein